MMEPISNAYDMPDGYATIGLQFQFARDGMIVAVHVMLWRWGLVLGLALDV